jgi:hypothetical protein
VHTQLDEFKVKEEAFITILMIEEEHISEDSAMGEQEKNTHFIDIMGHVIHILHTFSKFFS